jgi:hypothetical protein
MDKVELKGREIDHTRPVGVVYGSTEFAQEQDGVLYDHGGKPVQQWTTPEALERERVQTAARVAKEKAAAAKRDKEAALRKVLAEYMDK